MVGLSVAVHPGAAGLAADLAAVLVALLSQDLVVVAADQQLVAVDVILALRVFVGLQQQVLLVCREVFAVLGVYLGVVDDRCLRLRHADGLVRVPPF